MSMSVRRKFLEVQEYLLKGEYTAGSSEMHIPYYLSLSLKLTSPMTSEYMVLQ